jgi:hypothetical protein
MKTFVIKSLFYILLILIALELMVYVFHLYTEDPPRFIDEFGVEKRVPGETGHAVFGNRNQSYSEFLINNAGFNSHHDYLPSQSKFEVAIIGDSFIEGLHQDYTNSIAIKIESQIPGIEVYNYGYAGYDIANQLHLINSYEEDFTLIDEIIIYLNFENDLKRGSYTPNYDRITMLKSPLYKLRDNIKILSYGSKIGVIEPLKKLATGKAFIKDKKGYKTNELEVMTAEEKRSIDLKYLENFKNLTRLYGFDKSKTTLLLDSRKTSTLFLDYCNLNNIKYIDYSENFKKSKKPTTLIYDWHWNDHGRSLIAEEIIMHLKQKYESELFVK